MGGGSSTRASGSVPCDEIAAVLTRRLEYFHRDAAAAFGGVRNAGVDLVGDLIPTGRVGTVVSKARVLLARALRDGGVERDI